MNGGNHRGRGSNPPQQEQQAKQQPGWFARISQNIEMAQKGYEQLVHAIIRPPRAKYSLEQLGPSDFTFLGQRFQREDVDLPSNHHHTRDNVDPRTSSDTSSPTSKTRTAGSHTRESSRERERSHYSHDDAGDDDFDANENATFLNLKASIWTRRDGSVTSTGETTSSTAAATKSSIRTMVVYLHGNASARVEVLSQLSFLLAQGIDGVASLDFTGSGRSDGDYVSLGYFERYDLDCLLQYLQNRYGPGLEIVLWGRSMGASTALMHAGQETQENINSNPSNTISTRTTTTTTTTNNPTTTSIVKGLICDSPFASLPILCEELVERARSQGVVVPGVIVSVALAMISRSVRHHAHFDIREIAPIDHAPTIQVPALFVVGANDDFIPPHHSEELIAAYKKGVRTNLFMVPGGHNDARPDIVYEAAAQFFQHRLSLVDDQALAVPENMARLLNKNPPWAFARNSHIFQAHKKETISLTTNPSVAGEEELGMTKERQDDIQNKLHLMLGQGA